MSDWLASVIKQHGYLFTVGAVVAGPLAEAPSFDPDTETYKSIVYEAGKEGVAEYLVRNDCKITLNTKNIAWALGLIAALEVGQDLLAVANKVVLTGTPIGVTGEPSLVFSNCYLQPGLSYVPANGEDHTAKLVFMAKPDPTTKKLFTFAAGA